MQKESKTTYDDQDQKIELKQEELHVKKKKIKTGRVKISKKVLSEEIPLDLSGFEEDIEIKRIKIGRVVDKPGPAVRKDGDSTIFSLYREVYVKQTILEEEVRISKKKVHKSYKGKEKLKKEILNIERTPHGSLEEK